MKKYDSLKIIVKGTDNCNLNCKYCYVGGEENKKGMSEEVLEEVTKKVSKDVQESSWIWHGGEPLLLGLNFYKKVKEIQDYYGKKDNSQFRNSFQTNATLLSPEIIDFAKENNFSIGISLDGPKELNDLTRVNFCNEGSYEKVMGGVKLMKKAGLDVGALCVVNSTNIKEPRKLYEFFKNEGISVELKPLINQGNAETHTNLLITPQEYGEFLNKFFEIYHEDILKDGEVKIKVNPFLNTIRGLLVGEGSTCSSSKSCVSHFISMNALGDIYPCGRFDGNPYFFMGNLLKQDLETILNAEIISKLKKRENLEECSSCDYLRLCNSGCMHNAYAAGDILSKDPFCEAYKSLFGRIETFFETGK